jgi:hypothetical protein
MMIREVLGRMGPVFGIQEKREGVVYQERCRIQRRVSDGFSGIAVAACFGGTGSGDSGGSHDGCSSHHRQV